MALLGDADGEDVAAPQRPEMVEVWEPFKAEELWVFVDLFGDFGLKKKEYKELGRNKDAVCCRCTFRFQQLQKSFIQTRRSHGL